MSDDIIERLNQEIREIRLTWALESEALRAENARLRDLTKRLANTIEFLNSTHNAGEGEDIVAEARAAMGESDE